MVFLCLLCRTDWGAGSAASSPEASREEGWSMSAVEDCCATDGWLIEVRFLFPELEEEGEDMTRPVWIREGSEMD